MDEGALITTLISFCHLKTLVPVCLRNERPQNAFLTLIVNYRKIVQKNQLCYSKQQYIVYFMIYDVIQSLIVLIEKTCVFQQTVVSGLLHP